MPVILSPAKYGKVWEKPVKIYYLDSLMLKKDFDRLSQTVTEIRKEKLYSLKNENDKLNCLAVGVMLNSLLGITADEELKYNEYGKPYLNKGMPEIYFNFTHTGHLVFMAIDNEEIGIDAENIKSITPGMNRIIEKKYDSTERAYIYEEKKINADKRFAEIWTLKEAVIKYTGYGLKLEIERVHTNFSYLPKRNITGALIDNDEKKAVFSANTCFLNTILTVVNGRGIVLNDKIIADFACYINAAN